MEEEEEKLTDLLPQRWKWWHQVKEKFTDCSKTGSILPPTKEYDDCRIY